MRKEIVDRVWSGLLPRKSLKEHVPLLMRNVNSELKLTHSGTTVLSFFYNNGLLFAGDKKVSEGLHIISQDKTKFYDISPYSCFAAAGLVSDIQMLVNLLEEVNSGFTGRYGYQLSTEGQVNYLVSELRDFWQYSSMPMDALTILGGFDPMRENFRLFAVGCDGSKRECLDYAVVGSGSDFAVAKLEENRKKLLERKLTKEEAIEIAVQAIFQAGKKDMGTSDIRIARPSIATITKSEQFSFVEESVVENVVNGIVKEEL